MPDLEPESGIAKAINSLWDEVERVYDGAREAASRPGVRKAAVVSALGLASIAFLAPQDMAGRIRETVGYRVGAAFKGNEPLFASAKDKGPDRLLGATRLTKAPLRPAALPADRDSTARTAARAEAPVLQAAPPLPEVVESASPEAQSEAVGETPSMTPPPTVADAGPGSSQAAPVPAPAAATAPPATIVPAAGRSAGARPSGETRRLTAARGFSSGSATKISAASMARLGNSDGVRVQATEIKSAHSSAAPPAGSVPAVPGAEAAPSPAVAASGKADMPASGASAGAAGPGGTGGMAENGAGPAGMGGVLGDKRKCDESEKKYGPERDGLFKRVKELGDRRAAMGRSCKGVDCRQSFCDAEVCRSVWVCQDGANPACVKTVCEPRRKTSWYQNYCRCSDLRCEFSATCRKANEVNCLQMRACPLTATRKCDLVDCSQ